MFDPTKETEPNWDVDIRDDVILEVFFIFFKFLKNKFN